MFFSIIGLSQDIEHSSLCCTLGPGCLSILNVIVCIYQPQTPKQIYTTPQTLITLGIQPEGQCALLPNPAGAVYLQGPGSETKIRKTKRKKEKKRNAYFKG